MRFTSPRRCRWAWDDTSLVTYDARLADAARGHGSASYSPRTLSGNKSAWPRRDSRGLTPCGTTLVPLGARPRITIPRALTAPAHRRRGLRGPGLRRSRGCRSPARRCGPQLHRHDRRRRGHHRRGGRAAGDADLGHERARRTAARGSGERGSASRTSARPRAARDHRRALDGRGAHVRHLRRRQRGARAAARARAADGCGPPTCTWRSCRASAAGPWAKRVGGSTTVSCDFGWNRSISRTPVCRPCSTPSTSSSSTSRRRASTPAPTAREPALLAHPQVRSSSSSDRGSRWCRRRRRRLDGACPARQGGGHHRRRRRLQRRVPVGLAPRRGASACLEAGNAVGAASTRARRRRRIAPASALPALLRPAAQPHAAARPRSAAARATRATTGPARPKRWPRRHEAGDHRRRRRSRAAARQRARAVRPPGRRIALFDVDPRAPRGHRPLASRSPTARCDAADTVAEPASTAPTSSSSASASAASSSARTTRRSRSRTAWSGRRRSVPSASPWRSAPSRRWSSTAELAARLAPAAWLINFTNPVSIVTQAVRQHSDARVIGICDTPTEIFEDIAHALGLPSAECVYDYFGLESPRLVARGLPSTATRRSHRLWDDDACWPPSTARRCSSPSGCASSGCCRPSTSTTTTGRTRRSSTCSAPGRAAGGHVAALTEAAVRGPRAAGRRPARALRGVSGGPRRRLHADRDRQHGAAPEARRGPSSPATTASRS